MNENTGEIVVVVGAGPRLGAAVARRFGGERAAVALLARTPGRLDELVGALRADGVDAHGVPADAGDEASLRAAFGQVRHRLGDPTVLVFNASRYVGGAATALDVAELVDAFRVGVAAAVVAVQEVAPAMRREGRGTVLLTGNGLALRPHAGSSALGVVKAGLRNLAGSLAEELGPEGVHVATLTVAGVIGHNARLAPEALAEEYWRLHAQPRRAWEHEVVVR